MGINLDSLRDKPNELKQQLIIKAKEIVGTFKNDINKEGGNVSVNETTSGFEVSCKGISKELEDKIRLRLSQQNKT